MTINGHNPSPCDKATSELVSSTIIFLIFLSCLAVLVYILISQFFLGLFC